MFKALLKADCANVNCAPQPVFFKYLTTKFRYLTTKPRQFEKLKMKVNRKSCYLLVCWNPGKTFPRILYLYPSILFLSLSAISYYISLPFIYLLSATPFFILYRLSDGVYFVLYRLLGYRKKVVLANLKNSFPEKTEEEINGICKKYYHHLCDLFLEVLKTLTISKKAMIKHCAFDPETKKLLDRLADERKSVILVLGHQGNWEWAGSSFSLLCKQQLYVIYHPLSNKYFNGLMHRIRTRFKGKTITMRDTYKEMLLSKRSGEISATAFLADQTPHPKNGYWTHFLSQETPVFRGTELIAKKLNYPIVYASIKKIKRGYYEIFAEILEEFPTQTSDGMLSELHTRKLEKDIIEQPETWLWSHRRWKHQRPVDLGITNSTK